MLDLMAMEREKYRDCLKKPRRHRRMQCAACGCHRNFHRKIPLDTVDVNHLRYVGYSSPSSTGEEKTTSDRAKRRLRTKFSAVQKEKMLRFSEKIVWRILRRDGGVDEVGRFCREIGVCRQVFKVWMHNHMNTTSNSSSPSQPPAVADYEADGVNNSSVSGLIH